MGAIAFVTMLFIENKPIKVMAVYGAVTMITSLFSCAIIFPAFLVYHERYVER